ncbi:mammalian cell entry protein (plasmid) [Rhodococcus oxybenzonivorans]|uniref:Mammalian cell entry protein n=1 Tax=Rhodococcus oxybenzonivorans TaxID=1990687 RepID=A0A2S2C6W0_9NOCA|nr:MCE family protein [Rhodococcus oxybenzonivorans]AWK76606.1 mammalian cell entry protein [Rhodococcus oxybenzonivorans]
MKITGTIARLTLFAVIMVLFTAAVVVVFSQVRFGSERTYKAAFADASGLKSDEFVRVAGVEVGKVKSVEIVDEATALVEFSLTKAVPFTESTKLAVRYENLIGAHYLELLDSPGSNTTQPEDSTIPADRTMAALDLDALINGFRPLFKALDPDQVNKLSTSLVHVLQGQGGTVSDFLKQSGELTSALADRDQLIGSVIDNLNRVLGTVDEHNKQFDEGVDKLQQVISGLSEQSDPIGDALVRVNDASASVADLLVNARPAIRNDVTEIGRVAGNINADKDYVNWALSALPDAYGRLARLGLYGDFFTFYLCDVTLKVNGPDGNPALIPIIGQRAGRCTAQ